jgi:hypothetical protein
VFLRFGLFQEPLNSFIHVPTKYRVERLRVESDPKADANLRLAQVTDWEAQTKGEGAVG